MAQYELWFDTDLSKPQVIHAVQGNVFSQDRLANVVGVRVYDAGQAVSLSGTVKGYIILSDETTVVVSGTRSGNAASIVLPEAAYAVVGPIQIAVKLEDGSAVTTLAACTGYVHRSMTGATIDPGNVITDRLPAFPTSNGTYKLRCVKNSSGATLSWVADA